MKIEIDDKKAMEHTKSLIRELMYRERKSETGKPITDQDYRKAFDEIDSLVLLNKALKSIICILLTIIFLKTVCF